MTAGETDDGPENGEDRRVRAAPGGGETTAEGLQAEREGGSLAAAVTAVAAVLAERRTVDLAKHGAGELKSFDVKAYNALYALVVVGGRAVILEENWKVLGMAETPPHERVRFVAPQAFETWHANDLYRIDDKTWTGAQLWLRDAKRRQYRGIVFDPSEPPGGASGTYYNLWQGFSVEPDPSKRCDIFLDHLSTNVAQGNEGHAAFIMGWLAKMIQRPTERVGVALVLRGRMGVGKTVVGLHVGRLFEANYALVDDPRHIVGNFNAHMASLLLLQADEGFWAGDKQAEGRLRGLITSDRQMIELKGKDPIQVRNYVHLLVTSNADWVVPAGHEERRFAVFDVGDHCQQDHEYFAAMEAELQSGGYGRLLYELQRFDLKPIELRVLPKTAALYEQKLASLLPVESWWLTCLLRGWLVADSHSAGGRGEDEDDEGASASPYWPTEVGIERLHRSYLHFCERTGVGRRVHGPQFGQALRKLAPGLARVRASGGRGQARGYVYRVPDLEACRAAFEALVRTAIDWESALPLDDAAAAARDAERGKGSAQADRKGPVAALSPKPEGVS